MGVRRVFIKTEDDGTVLDAVRFNNPNAPQDSSKAKWIIWFNANGVIYEQILPFLQNYASRLNAHAIAFNYRGVGDSTGFPHVSEALKDDGRALIKYVPPRCFRPTSASEWGRCAAIS